MPSEKPILFNGDMVRAILDGRKTQTRRVVKGTEFWGEFVRNVKQIPDGWRLEGSEPIDEELGNPVTFVDVRCPCGRPGGKLWVRESWNVSGLAFGKKPRDTRLASKDAWRYQATDDGSWQNGWKPSIHMPRWASRLTLEITDVRVERLQDISEADAMAEGVQPELVPPDGGSCPHVEGFRSLWNSISSPATNWNANPFVWVVTFRRIEQ